MNNNEKQNHFKMKRILVISALAAVAAIASVIILMPSEAASQKQTRTVDTADIPDDLMKVFENSCLPCHGNEGKGISVSMLNFNEWSKYTPKKQVKKAGAICKVITKGSMPPASFIEANPGKAIAVTQKEVICKWAEQAGQ